MARISLKAIHSLEYLQQAKCPKMLAVDSAKIFSCVTDVDIFVFLSTYLHKMCYLCFFFPCKF